MIKVNLLPENLRLKKRDFNFPIFPVLFFLFIFLFIVYLVIVFNIRGNRQIVHEMDQSLAAVQSKSIASEQTAAELTKLNDFIDNVVYKSLISRYSLAMIMDTINEKIPEGVWLTELSFFRDEEGEKLRVRGFVKPIYSETMITVLGRLNNGLKEYFESIIGVSTQDGVSQKQIDFSLMTKRRQAEKIEITEFSTLFKL
ncbi:hypothetical protein ACFL3D_05710 [Candidatus Omnitrophota bacterium]